MHSKIKDRFLLLITSLLSMGLLLTIVIFIKRIVPEQWAKFIFMSLFYLAALIHAVFIFEPFKRIRKTKLVIFQLIYFILTASIVFVLFKYGLIPLPEKTRQYFIPLVFLGICSVAILYQITKRFKLFR